MATPPAAPNGRRFKVMKYLWCHFAIGVNDNFHPTAFIPRIRRWIPLTKHWEQRKIEDRSPFSRPLQALGEIDNATLLNAADPQSNSAFFQKLPAEIRLLIYEFAVGGDLIHLDVVYFRKAVPKGYNRQRKTFPRIVRWPCNWSQYHIHDLCTNAYPNFLPRLSIFEAQQSKSPYLQLALTCRKVYVECINSLYSSNHFTTDMPHVVSTLPQVLRPSALHSIRRISLISDFVITAGTQRRQGKLYTESEIETILTTQWEVLLSMRCLRNVAIVIRHYPLRWEQWRKKKRYFIDPILKFGHLRQIKLCVMAAWQSRWLDPYRAKLPQARIANYQPSCITEPRSVERRHMDWEALQDKRRIVCPFTMEEIIWKDRENRPGEFLYT